MGLMSTLMETLFYFLIQARHLAHTSKSLFTVVNVREGQSGNVEACSSWRYYQYKCFSFHKSHQVSHIRAKIYSYFSIRLLFIVSFGNRFGDLISTSHFNLP